MELKDESFRFKVRAAKNVGLALTTVEDGNNPIIEISINEQDVCTITYNRKKINDASITVSPNEKPPEESVKSVWRAFVVVVNCDTDVNKT